jgi:hypothetical protein
MHILFLKKEIKIKIAPFHYVLSVKPKSYPTKCAIAASIFSNSYPLSIRAFFA